MDCHFINICVTVIFIQDVTLTHSFNLDYLHGSLLIGVYLYNKLLDNVV